MAMTNRPQELSDQQIRAAAILASATFCAPCETSAAADVLSIAAHFEDFIRDGKEEFL